MALESFNPHVYERDSLVELSFGYTDGMKDEDIKKKYPDYWAQVQRAKAYGTKYFLSAPNGESRAGIAVRSSNFIDSMQRKTQEHGITLHVIVTHGGTGRIVAKQFLGVNYEVTDASRNPDNGDVLKIARSSDGIGFLDYGNIFRKGVPQTPEPIRYPTALERMKSNEFVPQFALPAPNA